MSHHAELTAAAAHFLSDDGAVLGAGIFGLQDAQLLES